MKNMKIVEFNYRIPRPKKKTKILLENHENCENYIISCEKNTKTKHENNEIPIENYENHENLIILFDNQENIRKNQSNMRIMKIIKI